MSLNRHLVNNTHERLFSVTYGAGGWAVIEKYDATILRHVQRPRWQPVEREIRQFEVIADELKRSGWMEY
jgi:hypothetical protein